MLFGFVELFIAAGALKVIELSTQTAYEIGAIAENKSPMEQGYIGMFD